MTIADNIADAIVTFVIDVVRAPFLAVRDARKQQRDRDRSEQIEQAAATAKTALPRHATAFASDVLARLRELPPDLYYRLLTAAQDLYDMEFTAAPEPPNTTVIEHARYLDQLARHTAKVANPETLRVFTETVHEAFASFLAALPEAAFSEDERTFSVPLADMMPNLGFVIEDITRLFSAIEVRDLGLFNQVREQLDYNLHYNSGVEFTPHAALPFVNNYKPPKLRRPSEDAAPNIAWRYLQNTPLADLFGIAVPFDFTRYLTSHAHVVGGSGSGKTQFLQNLILSQLQSSNPPGMVIVDSQADLINKISHLKLFDEGPLARNLIIIDPREIDHPPALNMFDINASRLDQYDPATREQVTAGVIETFDYLFSGIVGADLTTKQSVVFRYLARLMLGLPDTLGRNATILDLLHLMDDPTPYLPAIAQLPPIQRHFFERDFFKVRQNTFVQTKEQIRYRLSAILENPTLARLFTSSQNRIDLFQELNNGSIILVDTAKEFLKGGSPYFGRIFISLVLQAIQERAAIPEHERRRAYLIVDEAAEYFDSNIDDLLTSARKYNLGCLFAHQFMEQCTPQLRASLSANTTIKLCGGISTTDARTLAPDLRTTPDFILSQPGLSFACHVRGMTSHAVSLRIPYGTLEAQPRMSNERYNLLRATNRDRVSVPPPNNSQPEPLISAVAIPEPKKPSNNHDDASPSTKNWA